MYDHHQRNIFTHDGWFIACPCFAKIYDSYYTLIIHPWYQQVGQGPYTMNPLILGLYQIDIKICQIDIQREVKISGR